MPFNFTSILTDVSFTDSGGENPVFSRLIHPSHP